jgi:hypothetical protein
VLLLDEPTRGIDVGAKAEVQGIIDQLAAEGVGVLLISSELDELIEGSDRVVVLHTGSVVARLDGDEVTAPHLMRALAGEDPGGAALDADADGGTGGLAAADTDSGLDPRLDSGLDPRLDSRLDSGLDPIAGAGVDTGADSAAGVIGIGPHSPDSEQEGAS